MNSNKGVIRIIEKGDFPNGYDKHYYFSGVETDHDYHLMATLTSDIWQAKKFIYNLEFEDEMKRIKALIEFIKACYTPKKKYQIEFIPINLEY